MTRPFSPRYFITLVRRSPSLRRWIEILVYAAIAIAIVVLFLEPLLQPFGTAWGTHAGRLPFLIFYSLFVVLEAASIAALSQLRTLKPVHIFQLQYPSWIWTLAIASVYVLFFSNEPHNSTIDNDWRLLALTLVMSYPLSLLFLMLLRGNEDQRRDGAIDLEHERPSMCDPTLNDGGLGATPPVNSEFDVTTTTKRFLDWALRPEMPISNSDEDLFGASRVAERMAQHMLYDEHCPCIGIIGAFGSGKTGILQLLEQRLKPAAKVQRPIGGHRTTPRRIWVAWVRSWGLTSGASVAQLVLDAALDEMAHHVDCLTLNSVPHNYRRAIDASQNRWLKLLGELAGGPIHPEHTLQRFDPVLQALDADLVLFIEDLDRNLSDPSLLTEVQSLLDRLKQRTTRIHFVLAVGSGQSIDFAKVCDRYEMLTNLTPELVTQVVKTVFAQLRDEFPQDEHWSDLEPDDSKFFAVLYGLLNQPRPLRCTIRQLRHSWFRLHGTVDLNEMILVTALRTYSPSAFEFLAKHIIDLRGRWSSASDDVATHGKYLREIWDTAMEDVSRAEKRAAEECLTMLFPTWEYGSVAHSDNPQSIRHGPHAGINMYTYTSKCDYWIRMFSEDSTGNRDQEVVAATREWLSTPDRSRLPELIVNDAVFADCFLHLMSSVHSPVALSSPDTWNLATAVHKYYLGRDGAAADGDQPGCCNVWHMIKPIGTASGQFVAWLEVELEFALSFSLQFAIAMSEALDPAGSKARLGKVIRDKFKEGDAANFVSIVDPYPEHPWLGPLLYKLEFEDARWFVNWIVSAAMQYPGKLVPELAKWICGWNEGSEIRVNDALLATWFTEDKVQPLLNLIAKSRIQPSILMAGLMEPIRLAIKERLDSYV